MRFSPRFLRNYRGFSTTFSASLTAFALMFGAAPASTSAAVINLTTAGTGGTINGAMFEQTNPQSTGTGTINTFSQQNAQGSATSSHAYNTTENDILDNKSSDNFNHSISLGAVPYVLRGNTIYREFLLDTNENSGGGEEFLSLDEVQVFVGGTANSNVATFTGGILDHDGALVYRMDAGGDNWVALNYALNSGSGSGDMFMLIPASSFTTFADTDVVTLYAQFGLQGVNPTGFTGNFGSSDGFEEWVVREGIAPPGSDVPEPTAAMLAMFGVAGLIARRIRRWHP
jgi:hypothetical protein